ncbi:hypothetical protein P7K49_021199, partial [Saguinus oedipus]
MPGETHSAAPGTAADLARCQGRASLQQVGHLPGPRAPGGDSCLAVWDRGDVGSGCAGCAS